MQIIYLFLGYLTSLNFISAKKINKIVISISKPYGICAAGVTGKKVELEVKRCDFILIEYESVQETCAELDFNNDKLLIKKHMNCTVVAYTRNKEIDKIEFTEAGSIEFLFKFGRNTVVEMLENNAKICHSLTIKNPFMKSIGFRYLNERMRREFITTELSLNFGTNDNTSLIVRKGRYSFTASLYNGKNPFKGIFYKNGVRTTLPLRKTDDVIFDFEINDNTKLILSPNCQGNFPLNNKEKYDLNDNKKPSSYNFMMVMFFSSMIFLFILFFIGSLFF